MYKQAELIVRLVLFLWLFSGSANAQALPDLEADVIVSHPAFARDTGPAVFVDAGHFNYHTSHGRFAPFAALIRNDGFRVSDKTGRLSAAYFSGIDILVVSNALNPANINHWAQPVPSAFDKMEIDALRTWVENGGSLLLIADHFPFAGAAKELAGAFGFNFVNGHAADKPQRRIH